jgi:polyhydroxybutyrate depolymerase
MKLGPLIALLLISSSISGCLSDEPDASENLLEPDVADSALPALIEECMMIDEMERCWLIHIPTGYDEEVEHPLIVNLHGFTGNKNMFYNYSHFDVIAEENNVVVVYPQGYEDSWNAGWCCGEAKDEEIDDVGFILELVEYITGNFSIDDSRIYASGHSNGCAMTHKLANEASDIFAAAGCMALYLLDAPAPSYTPISLIEVHGLLDQIIPYGASYPSSVYFDQSLDGEEGAIQNIIDWGGMNGCKGGPLPTIFEEYYDHTIMGYEDCENGTEVKLVTLNFAGHSPYPSDSNNPTDVNTTKIVWEFLSKFSK